MRHILAALLFALPSSLRAEAPRVVADIAPVHSLVAMVMEGIGEPDLLLEPGTDLHHLQLKPSQARAVSGAELVVWVGPSLTPPLERIIARSDSQDLALSGAAEEEHGHDDHGHEDEHGHAEDVHAWLNPDEARHWLELIAGKLAGIDPENAASYLANAANWSARIEAQSTRIDEVFAGLPDRRVIVYHDAYDAFADRFGITVAGAIQDSHATRPGAAGLAALREEVAGEGVACILAEPGYDPGLVRAVAGEGDIALAVTDPAGSALVPGPELYLSLLDGMATAIAECLSD